MLETTRARMWSIPLRIALAAMWVAHGLEKFGVKWPPALAGGTQSVPDMLGLIVDETPIAVLRILISKGMLPIAHLMQYPLGILEIAIGVALAAGLWLRWTALLGAAIQVFLWIGFITLDWPFQYPLVILSHLALMDLHKARWIPILRTVLGVVWLYVSKGDPIMIAMGLLLLAGVGARILFPVALVLCIGAFRGEAWSSWPWAYYMVIAVHVAVLLGVDGEGFTLARFLPQRYRTWSA
jgi:uncharacterized membrane protein YphA (DoxX/SURF4 family)